MGIPQIDESGDFIYMGLCTITDQLSAVYASCLHGGRTIDRIVEAQIRQLSRGAARCDRQGEKDGTLSVPKRLFHYRFRSVSASDRRERWPRGRIDGCDCRLVHMGRRQA